MRSSSLTALTAASLASLALGQVVSQCPGVPAAQFPNYKVADGWSAKKVADGLSTPRGIVLDTKGRLLVVERSKGITQHEIDSAGCITNSQTLVADAGINHGIYFSPDGKTLYSTNPAEVFSWPYDPETGVLGAERTTLVTGMATSGHVTRTLIIPPSNPNLLVVSHGSGPNFDWPTEDPSVGRAIVKVFNITEVPTGGYNYVTEGWNAGYGLRNEVGLAFDGDEMLWGVENSGDNLFRYIGEEEHDIHIDNPAEELNFLGDVSKPNDQWYGYPICWTVGGPSEIPDFAFQVGDQMVQRQNSTFNDTTCAEQSKPPTLTFQAHSAPLDSKFDPGFDNLFVTLHGSWNRNPPTGYKLVAVPFQKDGDSSRSAGGYGYGGSSYAPVAALSDPRGYQDIFYPENEEVCNGNVCLRPVGLVFDNQGRLYMTSDDSGEIFLLTKA